MKLIDLLGRERVVLPLKARTLGEAAEELIHTLVVSGAAPDPERLEALQADTLPRDVVTVGQQAFLLHFRTDAAKEPAAALGVAPEPMSREHDSVKEARIVLLIVAPHGEASTYLQAVSAFARALGNPEIVDGIIAAETAEQILKIPALAKLKLPGYLMVRDLMSQRLLSVRSDATLGDAAKMMVTKDAAALPVVSENGEVLGMVSHRELIRFLLPLYVKRMKTGEFVAAGRKLPGETTDPRKIPVREVMDRSVLCVSEDQTLADVATMMANKDVAHVPVVREGILVGFLTRSNLVRRMIRP